jgi:nicotinamide-nucleotide amidase
MMNTMENPTLAPYAKDSEVLLRLTAKASSKEDADRMMVPALDKIREILGDIIYGIDTDSMENTVIGLLKAQNKTLAAAESCTGGLLAKRLTDIPGASHAFYGGATTYSTASKTSVLGIDAGFIREKGVVSSDVAAAMASAVRNKFGTDLGVGITGIAGPDSDDSGLEPGTVFVALSDGERTWCRSLHLLFDRARIRTAASSHALDMLRRYLTGKPVESASFTNHHAMG